jgi:putative oxidoreductase
MKLWFTITYGSVFARFVGKVFLEFFLEVILKETVRSLFHQVFYQLSRPFGRESIILMMRMWLGLIMLYHGSDKLFRTFDPFTAHLSTFGIPLSAFVSRFFTLAQFVGGALVFMGLLTRPALVCVIITVFSALIESMFYVNYDPFSRKGELAFTYTVLGFALLISGPGLYSLDTYLRNRFRRSLGEEYE